MSTGRNLAEIREIASGFSFFKIARKGKLWPKKVAKKCKPYVLIPIFKTPSCSHRLHVRSVYKKIIIEIKVRLSFNGPL